MNWCFEEKAFQEVGIRCLHLGTLEIAVCLFKVYTLGSQHSQHKGMV